MKTTTIIIIVLLVIILISLIILSKITKKSNTEQYTSDPDKEITLRTVNYNIFSRWFNATGFEGQNKRLAAIPEAIATHPSMGQEVDVITIEEAWCPDHQLISGTVMCGSNKSRMVLIDNMAKYGWKYHTDVVHEPGESTLKQQTSGGAIIFSRWPIDMTSSYVYNTRAGQDAHAEKGAIYVRITKTNSKGLKQAFNIIGTHLQAWSTPEGAKARADQLTELMNSYVPAIGIKENGTEPLLFQGDMNTDFVLYPEEVQNLLNILNAKLPDWKSKEQIFSSDPSTNFLVGKDGAAYQNSCLDSYMKQLNNGNGTIPSKPTAKCINIPITTKSGKPFESFFSNPDGTLRVGDKCTAFCPCCPHEMLDYILYSRDSKFLQPVYSNFEIIPLKSSKPLTYDWGWCDGSSCMLNKKKSGQITGLDLSDHYPVVANFVFRPVTQSFIEPDGCKNDNDCHLRWFSCRCTGPGCTIDGKQTSGAKNRKHPVNANCHYRPLSAKCFCRPGNK
jgi:endonuclease/exonuclease/phosphatase family metal-dependent hydrolase